MRSARQRQLCPPERRTEFEGWDTSYVHDTVDVFTLESGTTALGSAFGSREHINGHGSRCEPLTRCALRLAVLMTLPQTWFSLGSAPSKLMYHVRINGDLLDRDLLAAFDGQIRVA